MYAVDNAFVLETPAGLLEFKRPPQTDFTDWGGMIGPGGVSSGLELRESRSAIARTDGEIIGASYWGNRSIIIDVMIPIADPQLRGRVIERIYRRLNSIVNADGTLIWTEKDGTSWASNLEQGQAGSGDPVLTEGTPRCIPVRLQSMPTITHETGPAKAVQIVLNAKQTVIESYFDPTVHTATTFEDTAPWFPFEETAMNSIAAPTVFSATAYNYGSAAAWPIIEIEGPVTSGVISTTGGSFTIPSPVSPAITWAKIDTRPTARTIVANVGAGVFNAYSLVNISNWNAFAIPPAIEDPDDPNGYTGGTRTISASSLTGIDIATTRLKIQWRWAWL